MKSFAPFERTRAPVIAAAAVAATGVFFAADMLGSGSAAQEFEKHTYMPVVTDDFQTIFKRTRRTRRSRSAGGLLESRYDSATIRPRT